MCGYITVRGRVEYASRARPQYKLHADERLPPLHRASLSRFYISRYLGAPALCFLIIQRTTPRDLEWSPMQGLVSTCIHPAAKARSREISLLNATVVHAESRRVGPKQNSAYVGPFSGEYNDRCRFLEQACRSINTHTHALTILRLYDSSSPVVV